MKKSIFILPVVVISFLIALVFFLKPSQQETEHHSISNQDTEIDANINTSAKEGPLQTSLKIFELLHPLSKAELAQIKIPEYLQEKKANRPIYFTFDHHKADQLKEGEQFNINLPESNINRVAIVDEIEKLDDDIVRITGTFKGHPEDINYFSLTQTKSDQYAVLRVITDRGDYVIEIKDGIGMLESSVIHSSSDQSDDESTNDEEEDDEAIEDEAPANNISNDEDS